MSNDDFDSNIDTSYFALQADTEDTFSSIHVEIIPQILN